MRCYLPGNDLAPACIVPRICMHRPGQRVAIRTITLAVCFTMAERTQEQAKETCPGSPL